MVISFTLGTVGEPEQSDICTYCSVKEFSQSDCTAHELLTAAVQISYHASLKPEGQCQMASQCLHTGHFPDSLAAPICAGMLESGKRKQ